MSRRRRLLMSDSALGYVNNGLQLFLDSYDVNTIVKSYVNIAATGSGTSGTTIITASGSVANLVKAGQKLRIGTTDIYTVASVSTVTITTVETLTSTYIAAALALDKVSRWNDKSGMGNDYTQATDLKKFIYNPNRLNGGAVLDSDGVSYMAGPSSLYTLSNGPNTIITIGKRDIENANSMCYFALSHGTGTSAPNTLMIDTSTSGNNYFQNIGGNSGLGVTTTGGTNTNYHMLAGTRSGTSESIRYNNGAAVTNTAATDVSNTDGAFIGSYDGTNRILIGSINIIMAYNRALTVAELTQNARHFAALTAISMSNL